MQLNEECTKFQRALEFPFIETRELWNRRKLLTSCLASDKWFSLPVLLGFPCPPSKNSAAAAPLASPSEAGSLLPAQHNCPHASHVHVCLACSLDGLHLVCHREKGDGTE